MNVVESMREIAIKDLNSTKTFNMSWPTWKNKINSVLGTSYNHNSLIDLSYALRDIFKTTSVTGRSQSTVSMSGVAWESLICWYINLCCIGSRVVALRKMSLTPEPIRNSLTVTLSN